MKCSNCGAEWNEGEKFCAVCGQPVNAEQSGNTVKPVNTGQTGSVTQPAAGQSVEIGRASCRERVCLYV